MFETAPSAPKNRSKTRPGAPRGRDQGCPDAVRQGSQTLKNPHRFDYAPSTTRSQTTETVASACARSLTQAPSLPPSTVSPIPVRLQSCLAPSAPGGIPWDGEQRGGLTANALDRGRGRCPPRTGRRCSRRSWLPGGRGRQGSWPAGERRARQGCSKSRSGVGS